MPSEKTLNLPLSGAEVLTAITKEIETRLRRDCYLSPTTAYQFFRAEVSIKLWLHDVGHVNEVNQEIATTAGDSPENPDEFLDIAESQFLMIEEETKSVNKIREDSGQEIPVAVTRNGKEEIKSVRYATKGKGKK